jgi:hypothetical protein
LSKANILRIPNLRPKKCYLIYLLYPCRLLYLPQYGHQNLHRTAAQKHDSFDSINSLFLFSPDCLLPLADDSKEQGKNSKYDPARLESPQFTGTDQELNSKLSYTLLYRLLRFTSLSVPLWVEFHPYLFPFKQHQIP